MEFLRAYDRSLEPGNTAASELLTMEIAQQAHGGPGVEPPTAAMFQAILAEKNSAIGQIIIEAAEIMVHHRRINVGAAASALRTTFVDYFRAKYKEIGEAEFSDAELLKARDWKPLMAMLKEDLETDSGMAVGSMHAGIAFRQAATPVKERYYPPELVTQFAKDRFPNGVRGLDIGSSIFPGPLQLMNKAQFPMEFEAVTFQPFGDGTTTDLTDEANGILGRPSIFREIVCVDHFPVYNEARQSYDIGDLEFAISGLRPSERNNPAYTGVIKALLRKKQEHAVGYDKESGVTFHQADLLRPTDLAEFKEAQPEPFDLIMMNYVTQELSPEDQPRLHYIARSLLSENGLIIYNHQAYLPARFGVRPTSVRNLVYRTSYATVPNASNMHLEDALHSTRGVQEMMGYYDNRCQRVRLGAGRLVVNGALEPIADLVRNS